jgi:hypothetical protein
MTIGTQVNDIFCRSMQHSTTSQRDMTRARQPHAHVSRRWYARHHGQECTVSPARVSGIAVVDRMFTSGGTLALCVFAESWLGW